MRKSRPQIVRNDFRPVLLGDALTVEKHPDGVAFLRRAVRQQFHGALKIATKRLRGTERFRRRKFRSKDGCAQLQNRQKL